MAGFFKKKRNVPGPNDYIVYANVKQLRELEGLTLGEYQRERKMGAIQKCYRVIENKGEFVRYSKGYVRVTSLSTAEKTYKFLKRKAKKIYKKQQEWISKQS